jgi:SAM-dependent methyltransferase
VESTEIRKLVTLEDRHWWYRERRHLVRRLACATDDLRGAVAVDVGAAGGGNTRVLREQGLFAVSLEYGPDGAAVAHERGLPSIRGDARTLPLAEASADVVVAFDVLEHIEDDHAVLNEFARVLREDGQLWIAVPSDMRLWSAHDDAVGHVRRYEREELVALVAGAGFNVVEMGSWNVLLRPVVRLRRRQSRGSDLGETGPLANWALTRIIRLERHLQFLARRNGVSLILVARRLPVSARSVGGLVDDGQERDPVS